LGTIAEILIPVGPLLFNIAHFSGLFQAQAQISPSQPNQTSVPERD
jgi:hypothetical protein